MLIDFGISAKVDNGARTSFAGSPETMAPEVFEGRPYGLQADIYSVGVIAYRLVTGSPPFISGNDYRDHPSKGQAPQKRGLTEQYYKLVKSMCEYHADNRIKFDGLWDSPFLNMNVLT
jgi:serine/threonine protein kinase